MHLRDLQTIILCIVSYEKILGHYIGSRGNCLALCHFKGFDVPGGPCQDKFVQLLPNFGVHYLEHAHPTDHIFGHLINHLYPCVLPPTWHYNTSYPTIVDIFDHKAVCHRRNRDGLQISNRSGNIGIRICRFRVILLRAHNSRCDICGACSILGGGLLFTQIRRTLHANRGHGVYYYGSRVKAYCHFR